MLQAIRDRLGGWFFFIFLAVIALAFTFWGVDFGIAGQKYVAQVNGEELPTRDIQQQYQGSLRRLRSYYPEDLPEPMVNELKQNVVDQAIGATLLEQRARELNMRVSNQFVKEAIMITEAFQEDGKFSPSQYQRLLQSQGFTPEFYEQRLRQGLTIKQIEDSIVRSAFATDVEANRRIALEQERREMAFVTAKVSDFVDTIEVSDEDIEAYYEQNQSKFVEPERIDIEYVQLSPNSMASEADISEEDLKNYYASELDTGRFDLDETRQSRHILIAVPSDGDEEAYKTAKVKADEVMAKLNGGEDFAELAKAYSDDPGSKSAGGDLGFANRAQFVGPFADAVFTMQENEVRGPVRTRFGWHVIELLDIKDGETKTFAQVRDNLLAELKRQTTEQAFYDAAVKLDELAFEYPTDLNRVSDELGLTIMTLDGVTRAQGTGIALLPEVRVALFEPRIKNDGENTRVIEMGDDSVVVARVTNVVPEAPKSLDEVRDEVVSALKTEQAQIKAKAQAEAWLAELDQGQSIQEITDDSDVAYTWIDRQNADVPDVVKTAVFNAYVPEGDAVTDMVSLPNQDLALVSVRAVQPGIGANTARRAQYAVSTGNTELASYNQALRSDADIKINLDLLQ